MNRVESHFPSESTNRIIVVDNDKASRDTIACALEGSYQVTTASSGPEALRILSEIGRIYAMISDLEMPNMNGVELLTRVREMQEYAKLILMSARFSAPDFNRNDPKYLIAEYALEKPVRIKLLREVLKAI